MKFAILAFMRIGIIGYGSLVNHSHSDVYDKTLEAKKPEVEMALPQDINLNPNSPFVPAQDLALPVRLGRVSESAPINVASLLFYMKGQAMSLSFTLNQSSLI